MGASVKLGRIWLMESIYSYQSVWMQREANDQNPIHVFQD